MLVGAAIEVVVDRVGQSHVGKRAEAMGHAGGDQKRPYSWPVPNSI